MSAATSWDVDLDELLRMGKWATIMARVFNARDEFTRKDDVLPGLGIPVDDIHLAIVNGQLIELDEAVVTNHDEVKIFPPVGGG